MDITREDAVTIFSEGFTDPHSGIVVFAAQLASKDADGLLSLLHRALDEWQGSGLILANALDHLIINGFRSAVESLLDHRSSLVAEAAKTSLARYAYPVGAIKVAYREEPLVAVLLDRPAAEWFDAEYVPLLTHGSELVRRRALARLPRPATPQVLAALYHPLPSWPDDRAPVEWVTYATEVAEPRLIDLLVAVFLSWGAIGAQRAAGVQTRLVDGLARIGDAKAAQRLVELLDNDWNHAPASTLHALSAMGHIAAGPVRDAYTVHGRMRRSGAATLARVLGNQALPLLLEALGDTFSHVRQNAITGLEVLGPTVLGALHDFVAHTPGLGRPQAVTACGAIGGPQEVATMVSLVNDRDPEVQEAALAALGRIDTVEAFEALSAATRDRDPRIRRLAAGALGHHTSRDADSVLIGLGEDPHPRVREAAAKALRRWRSEQEKRRGSGWRDTIAYAPPSGPPLEPTAHLPQPVTDDVVFTVVAPAQLRPGHVALLDVFAHTGFDVDLIVSRAAGEFGEPLRHRSKGPVPIERGAALAVRILLPTLEFDDEDLIYWTGSLGNASFAISVPAEAAQGPHAGTAVVTLRSLAVARVRFVLVVGLVSGKQADVTSSLTRVRSAFSSYASEDREQVLARVQGMQKILPDLDVFLDVVALRSGEQWKERLQEEILARDIFFLFWSEAAMKSKWVDFEWRFALQARGAEFISPVPLVLPAVAPPPQELRSMHFGDWTLSIGGAS